jgi:hypothetical protein
MSATAHAILIAGLLRLIASHPVLGILMQNSAALALALRGCETVPWSSATFQGERHRLEFSLCSAAPGFSAEAAEAACALVDLLDHVRVDPALLALPGHALIDVTFEGIETLTSDSPDCVRACGCVVKFCVLTLIDVAFLTKLPAQSFPAQI